MYKERKEGKRYKTQEDNFDDNICADKTQINRTKGREQQLKRWYFVQGKLKQVVVLNKPEKNDIRDIQTDVKADIIGTRWHQRG